MADHAPISISGLHKYVACPGCRAAETEVEASVPDSVFESDYAREGTKAHTFLEDCQELGLAPEHMTEDRELSQAVDQYMALVDELVWLASDSAEVLIEHRVKYSQNVWGTADTIIWDPETAHLVIVDFKYGLGDRVPAKRNYQLAGYHLAFCRTRSVTAKTAEHIIVQPRKNHVDRWMPDAEWLEHVALRMDVAGLQVGGSVHQRVPGSGQCQYCKASGVCPEQYNLVRKLLETDMELITPEQMSEQLASRKLVKNWLESVERHANVMWENGEKIPGWKKVRGSARRAWTDEDEVVLRAKALGADRPEEYCEIKIKSPAQMGKILDLAELEDLIIEKPTKDKWVTEDSTGKDVPSIASDMDDI